MPFDIKTAKPVSGFDISTAKPVLEPVNQGLPQLNLLRAAGIGTALGLGAKGVQAGISSIREPFIQSRNITNELMGVAKQYGLSGINKQTNPMDIPYLINKQSSVQTKEMKVKLDNLKNSMNESLLSAKESIKIIDNIAQSPVEDITKNFKQAYPKIYKQAKEGYGIGVKATEDFIESGVRSGKVAMKPDIFSFGNAVLDGTISDARSVGFTDDELKAIISLSDKLGGKNKPLSFGEAKMMVRNLSKTYEGEHIATLLQKNWLGYMAEISPGGEVRGMVSAINKEYKPIMDMRNALGRKVNLKAGEMDTEALNRYFYNYAVGKRDTGISKVMSLTAGGGGLTEPNPQLGTQFEGLTKLRNTRQALVNAPESIQQTFLPQINPLQKAIQDEGINASKWALKADQLASRLSTVKRGVAKRLGVARGLGKAAALGAGFKILGHTLGVAPSILQSSQMAQTLKNIQQRGGGINLLGEYLTPEEIKKSMVI